MKPASVAVDRSFLVPQGATVRTGYVPLMRRGDHYISVKEKVPLAGGMPTTKWFELVETRKGLDALTEPRTVPKGYTPKAVAARVAELRAKFPAALVRTTSSLRRVPWPTADAMALRSVNVVLFS